MSKLFRWLFTDTFKVKPIDCAKVKDDIHDFVRWFYEHTDQVEFLIKEYYGSFSNSIDFNIGIENIKTYYNATKNNPDPNCLLLISYINKSELTKEEEVAILKDKKATVLYYNYKLKLQDIKRQEERRLRLEEEDRIKKEQEDNDTYERAVKKFSKEVK
jgi:hypothetical protein